MQSSIVADDMAQITSASLPWDDFSGATVLVTGAAGFLPAYMVETLLYLNEHRLAKPAKVIALVRNLDRASFSFAWPPFLLNHVVVGILLIPIGVSTIFCASGVRAGEREDAGAGLAGGFSARRCGAGASWAGAALRRSWPVSRC